MRLATGIGLADLRQLRSFMFAPIKHLRATWIESATFGNGVQARHGAIDLVEALTIDFHVWNRGHQACRVGMLRMIDHLMHRAHFDNAACIHHGHTVAGFCNHTHVVRDQHDGSTALFTNVLEQADDLRLNRNVQGCGGLVSHNELRLGGQGQCNDHPLAHATRKLMRVVINALCRSGNASVLQQGNGPLTRFLIGHGQMRLDGFGKLLAHGVQRIERRQWILKNSPNFATANAAHLVVVQVVDALTLQQYFATGHTTRRLEQTNDGRASQGFARTRLAHHAQDFSRCNFK